MRSRLIIIIVAVLLGVTAALLAARYLQTQQARIAQGAQLVTVLVAQQDLPQGLTAAELLDRGYVTQRQVPRQYVAGSAISSRVALDGKVVAQPISKDQQLTDAMFRYAADVGLASSTPKDYLAVSIPYQAARGVAGLLRPNDFVAVYATFEPDKGGLESATTKVIIPKAKVLAVGELLTATSENDSAPKTASTGSLMAPAAGSGSTAPGTITLALTPKDAGKIVFAQEEGAVWLGLFSSVDPSTPGAVSVDYSQIAK
jgi:pilus assembly protein CpaB